jgi:hypothetical protein
MNTMQGAFFFACSNMSRTRAAPTPTNISTKSEPEIEKNGTFRFTRYGSREQCLPGPGEPTISTPRGMRPPSFWNLDGIAQEVDELGDLLLGFVHARDVPEGDLVLVLVEHARAALAEAECAAASPAPASGA